MKKKFYRSCVSMLLTMVMIFGGVHIGAGAVKPNLPVVPPFSSLADVSIVSPTSTHIAIGDTLQLTCITDPAGCAVEWSSNNINVATVDEDTGEVTGKNAGTVTITVIAYDPIVSSFTLTDTITITVHNSVGICDNEGYYIMNCSNELLLGMQNNMVRAVGFSNKDNSKWLISDKGDGSFSLKNISYGANGQYLSIVGNDTCLDNTGVGFSLQRVTSGLHDGQYMIRYDNKYIACNSNGVVSLTTALDENCYWSFMKVEKGHASFYNHYFYDSLFDDQFDTIANNSVFNDVFTTLGYDKNTYKNKTAEMAYNSLQEDDVFIVASHGEPGIVFFYDNNGREGADYGTIVPNTWVAGGLYEQPIDELFPNALASARCVLYLGCNTGNDTVVNNNIYNLVDETFEKGAHFVLGLQDESNTGIINDWLKGFLLAIEENLSIEEAIAAGNAMLGVDNSATDGKAKGKGEGGSIIASLPIYCRGDQKQYLSFPN